MTESRRRFPRIGVRLPLSGAVREHVFGAETANLSFGGAFLRAKVPWPEGIPVTVSIVDPDGVSHESVANVVHQHADGVGIAFVKPSREFIKAVCRIIADGSVEDEQIGDVLPGRIAMLVDTPDAGYRLIFSTLLGLKGGCFVTESADDFPDKFTVTLSEHGLFDSAVQVRWRQPGMLGLAFVDPPAAFSRALERILASFAG